MSPPLKICHVITTTRMGGAETQLLRFLQASAGQPWRQSVVCLEPAGELAQAMAQAGAALTCLDLRPSPAGLLQGLGRLRAYLAREQPQLVQTWMYHADLLGLLAVQLPPRPAGRPPVIWSLRCSDLEFSPRTRALVWLCARLSRRPWAILANSQAGASFHARLGYATRRLRVIPNGFDTTVFRPDPQARVQTRAELGLEPQHLAVIRVARHDPNKDLETFLAAAREAALRQPCLRFILVGQGMSPENPALAPCQEPPLRGLVQLLGRREDLPRLLAGMDLYLQSSKSEGLPGALGEAMSAGLCCVATDVGDSALMLGEAGFLAPPGQPFALAQALLSALALPADQRLALGLRARRNIVDNYGLEALVQAQALLFDQALGLDRPNPPPTDKE